MLRSPVAARLGLSLLLAALAGCGLFDNLVAPSDEELSIQRFAAAPEEVARGGETTLQWLVSGADLVEIDQGVGPVQGKGSLRITPDRTTTYTLVAMSGTSRATSTVQVVVRGTSASTPTPTPRPGATPTPLPTPAPTPIGCGGLTSLPLNCNHAVARHRTLFNGECIELNELLVDTSCPVTDGRRRVIGFTLTAHTSDSLLRWRQASENRDVLLPNEGVLSPDGVSTVLLNDTVRGASLSITVYDSADRPLLSFSLQHR